jgi:hydrogenase maturation protein HypF
MTSGNRSDEPIAYEDSDAVERLGGIADVFLSHNRPIQVRCDDSVTRVVDAVELPIRRSRGDAPRPVQLPVKCERPILAVGGQLKATFALGRDRQAFISHHLGDLDHFEAFRAFERDLALYEELFAIRPERIAHDLHPDYASTRFALQRAARDGVQLIPVQHHHAHMASCMAEHGLTEPMIGVTFDGTGCGADGAVWGGEFLVGDLRQFRRAAHLRYVCMPGGEQAIREPWRMAVACLIDAGCDPSCLPSLASRAGLRTIETMLQRRLNTPATSSAGRLFDAVAALTGVRDKVKYEGQAAIELEWLATGVAACCGYPFEIDEAMSEPERTDAAPTLIVDTRPLIRAVMDDVRHGVDCRVTARRFHSTMAEMITAVCERIRCKNGLDAVTLSGGVFMNALLTIEATRKLTAKGFRVYRHCQIPPNDGGLSLGQLAIAAARE